MVSVLEPQGQGATSLDLECLGVGRVGGWEPMALVVVMVEVASGLFASASGSAGLGVSS